MKDKNILIFLNLSLNDGGGISGGDQMLIQVFKRIRKNFGEIHCFTSADGKETVSNNVKGIKFHLTLRVFDKLPLSINYVLRTLQGFRCLFEENIDIIYGGSDFFPDVFPAFLYKIFHPKAKWVQCIFHIYPDWKMRLGNKLKNFVAQYLQKFSLFLIKRADIIININHQVKEELVKKGFNERKIRVNTPGINLEYLEKLNPGNESREYEGSFIARLNPSKGIFDLIKIWKIVVSKLPEAKLAIIGGGDSKIIYRLKRNIEKENLKKNIDILGFLKDDEAFKLIKKSKVFLFPSHEEGFGIVIAEAMACGVPVVSWNLKVYKEIFEDHSIQVRENNFNLFSDKVIELIKDDTKREEIGAKGKIFVKKYSWDNAAERQLEFINN